MQKEWIFKPQADSTLIDDLAQSINVSKPIASLLLQRGIQNFEEARHFFRPGLRHLYDPFLMKDMELAVARLDQAVKGRENVLVYGDYDVDGTTSVAMMYSFLKNRCRNVFYYIPDRYTEGYGISYKGIDFAAEKGCKLIIALDCGIKSVPKVEYATQKGIDFIICDHHEPGETLPPAAAVLDPKRPDCPYPFKELSACGVGFKFIQAFAHRNKIPFYQVDHFLDLVVVSIASDIVPIVDENRILAYYGLKRLNTKPRIGLKAIMNVAGAEPGVLKINDLVFKIGPRINAAGRMELGRHSVDLLVERDENIARQMAEKIDCDNTDRKFHDSSITKEALAMIDTSPDLQTRKSTVLYNPEWHKGVIGIVASRLIDTYYRPTVICTRSNGFITGSARSVPGFNLYAAVERCQDLLENFGGHMYAAGLTLKEENLDAFIKKFEDVVCELIDDECLTPKIEVDVEMSFSEISNHFYKVLEQFEPYGPGNMSPVFLTRKVSDTGFAQCVGTEAEHLRMYLTDESVKRSFPAIAFKQAHHHGKTKDKNTFDICYSLESNTYQGKTSIQLKIRDIKE
jgi:single-stranded-DNA-specific exonuclease